MEEMSAEDPTQDDDEENKTEEQKAYEIDGKVLLTCGKCIAEVECDRNYFGTNYYLAPYPTDKSYLFICSNCDEKPYLKHLEKSWTDIALCALTTLEMMGGWALFSGIDVESFVDSNFEELAINKDQEDDWPDLLRHELDNCTFVQRQELGGQTMYSLHHRGVAPLAEAHFVPEKALAVSKNSKGEAMYKIKWEGFDEKYATWEPITNLSHMEKIIPKGMKLTEIIKEEQQDEEQEDEETGDAEESLDKSTGDDGEQSQPIIVPIKRKASLSPERKGEDKKRSPRAAASGEKDSVKKARAKKQAEVIQSIVPTTHHTFQVTCSKCAARVPVTELVDTMIEPTFNNWTLLCSACTNGPPSVTFSGEPSVKEVTRRTLFMLHVHNPNQGFFTTTEMANLFLTKPGLAVNSDLHNVPEIHLRRLIGSRISSDPFIRPLYVGSGRYQFMYSSDINYSQILASLTPKPRKPRNKLQLLSPSSSLPPLSPSLPPPSAHESTEFVPRPLPTPKPAVSPAHVTPPAHSSSSAPPSSDSSTPSHNPSLPSQTPTPPPPSHMVSYPPHPYYPYAGSPFPYPYPSPYPYPPYSSPFYHTPENPYTPHPSTPHPPTQPTPPAFSAENQKQDSESISGALPDVFVQWIGEEDVIGFIRVSLERSLADLRQDLKDNEIVGEEKYIFLYKSAPVKPQQETRLFLRECATKTEDGYLLKVKRSPP